MPEPRVKYSIGIDISLHEALAHLGLKAKGSKAEALSNAIAAKVGDTKIPITIEARQLFACAADELRRQGKTEAVADLEELVKEFWKGERRPVIRGSGGVIVPG